MRQNAKIDWGRPQLKNEELTKKSSSDFTPKTLVKPNFFVLFPIEKKVFRLQPKNPSKIEYFSTQFCRPTRMPWASTFVRIRISTSFML